MRVIHGETLTEAGRYYGVTGSRVRQSIENVVRAVRCGHVIPLDEPYPDHDDWSVPALREHRDFWDRQLTRLFDEVAHE